MANYAPWPVFGGVRAIKIVKKDDVFSEFLLANGEIYCATGLMLEQFTREHPCFLWDDDNEVRVTSQRVLLDAVRTAAAELDNG